MISSISATSNDIKKNTTKGIDIINSLTIF